MDSDNIDLDSYWQKLKEDERVAYTGRFGGLPLGTVFQFAEHSPEKVEKYTGIEVPQSLFEDVLNPVEADKGMHFYFSYSAANAIIDSIEKSPREMTFKGKAATVNASTLFFGSLKEFSDNRYDPMDMAANLIGSNYALYQHKNLLEDRYEQSLQVNIDTASEFLKADRIHYELRRADIDPSSYLEGDEPVGI
jgi:hypothetical protein